MKIKSLFIAVLILVSEQAISQTNIPGGVVEGTWTKSNSPYLVQGAILVPNSKTLNIESGVMVEFQGSYKFSVLGELNAIGTLNDSITFTANDTSIGWLGIRFENTSDSNNTSDFSYCKFEYGKATSPAPLDSGGAIFIEGYSKVNISNSLIENCYAETNGGAIFCDNDSSPTVNNNIIRNNTAKERGGGIYAGSSCSPLIENNLITSNTVIEIAGGGIYQYDSGSGSPIIKNNEITYNIGIDAEAGGIRVLSKSAIIMNNVIAFNEANGTIGGGGIYIGKIGTGGTGNIISHNIIANNKSIGEINEYGGGGIFCNSDGNGDIISNNLIVNNSCSENGGGVFFSSSSPIMFNNTITNNSSRNGAGIFCKESSNPEINNSIIWGNLASSNGNQIYIEDEGSNPNIYYCDIEGGSSGVISATNTFYLGEYLNNINSNPLFNNPSSGAGSNFDGFNSNWTLNTSIPSPCINQVSPISNTSSVDLAGNQRVFEDLIDMGCYESQETILSIDELNNNTFSIYPIPVLDYININGKRQINKLVIYNLQGQIIREYSKIDKLERINVSDLITGIYLVRLNNSISYKILKK